MQVFYMTKSNIGLNGRRYSVDKIPRSVSGNRKICQLYYLNYHVDLFVGTLALQIKLSAAMDKTQEPQSPADPSVVASRELVGELENIIS